jgi:hypothetical protein
MGPDVVGAAVVGAGGVAVCVTIGALTASLGAVIWKSTP